MIVIIIELKPRHLCLAVPPGTGDSKKKAIIEQWYRSELKQVIPSLIEKWEALLDVEVEQVFLQRMKTKWGSCDPKLRNIRLNTELAKKSSEFLEYVVVHEMTHLLEPTHNQKFIKLMDDFIPKWRFYRDELNRSLLVHEQWRY
ncbi:MAG: DUF45 domain-containing protein [Gammaproteobacteria bacterium]|nr:DUF45 domain-containing protein [Gammaproteobacteria bacterium]